MDRCGSSHVRGEVCWTPRPGAPQRRRIGVTYEPPPGRYHPQPCLMTSTCRPSSMREAGRLRSRKTMPTIWRSGRWRSAAGGSPAPPSRPRQELIETALELDMNLIDTADIYGRGHGGEGFGAAEELLGKVLAAAPELRDRMVLATKGGISPGGPLRQLARPTWRRPATRRCERLGVDVIDVFQVHRPDLFTHPLDVAETLDGLVASGKVRARRRLQLLARPGLGAHRVPRGAARLHPAGAVGGPPRPAARRHPRPGHGPGPRRPGVEPARRRPPGHRRRRAPAS